MEESTRILSDQLKTQTNLATRLSTFELTLIQRILSPLIKLFNAALTGGKSGNNTMRANMSSDESLSEVKRLIKEDSLIASVGLNKLPAWEGEAYYGIIYNPNLEDIWQINKEFTEKGFILASKDTTSEAYRNSNVKFKVLSKSGRDVTQLSQLSGGKGDIIFIPNSRYKVIKRETIGNSLLITLEQLNN